MSSDKNAGVVGLVSFLTGAAIGAGLALLFAPHSGEETRKKLKDYSGKVADEVKDGYEKITKEAKKSIESVKSSAEKAIDTVKAKVKKETKEEEEANA